MGNRENGNLVKKRFPLREKREKTDHEKNMVDAQRDRVNEPLPQKKEKKVLEIASSSWLFRNSLLNQRPKSAVFFGSQPLGPASVGPGFLGLPFGGRGVVGIRLGRYRFGFRNRSWSQIQYKTFLAWPKDVNSLLCGFPSTDIGKDQVVIGRIHWP